MNEEAIKDAYNLFVQNGYKKSIDEFKTLMSSTPEALNDSYNIFVKNGYNKSIDDYKTLIGVSGGQRAQPVQPTQQAQDMQQEQPVDEGHAQPPLKKKEQPSFSALPLADGSSALPTTQGTPSPLPQPTAQPATQPAVNTAVQPTAQPTGQVPTKPVDNKEKYFTNWAGVLTPDTVPNRVENAVQEYTTVPLTKWFLESADNIVNASKNILTGTGFFGEDIPDTETPITDALKQQQQKKQVDKNGNIITTAFGMLGKTGDVVASIIINSVLPQDTKNKLISNLNNASAANKEYLKSMQEAEGKNQDTNIASRAIKGIVGMAPDLLLAAELGPQAAEAKLAKYGETITKNAAPLLKKLVPNALGLIERGAQSGFTKLMAIEGAVKGVAETKKDENYFWNGIKGSAEGALEGMYMHGLGEAAGAAATPIAKLVSKTGVNSAIATAIATPLANAGVFATAKALRMGITEQKLVSGEDLAMEAATGVGFSLLHLGSQYKNHKELNHYYDNVLKDDAADSFTRVINETKANLDVAYTPDLTPERVKELQTARDEIKDAILKEPDLKNKTILGNEAIKIQNQLDAHASIKGIVENKDFLVNEIAQNEKLDQKQKDFYTKKITAIADAYDTSPLGIQKREFNNKIGEAQSELDKAAQVFSSATKPSDRIAAKIELDKRQQELDDYNAQLTELIASKPEKAEVKPTEAPEKTAERIARIADIEATLSQPDNGKGTVTVDDKLIERSDLETELKTLKTEQDAIQKQSTNEGVLRTEQPELGLQEVGQGNAQPERVTTGAEEAIAAAQPQEVVNPLETVESTTTALGNLDMPWFDDFQNKFGEEYKTAKEVAEAYQKAKADNSNPELVKAVESLLVNAAPVVEAAPTVEAEQYVPMPTTDLSHDAFTRDNAIDFEEDEKEGNNGRTYSYISSLTVEARNADGESIGTITKKADEDGNLSFEVENTDGKQLHKEGGFETLKDAKKALVDDVNKTQKKAFDKEAKAQAKIAEKAAKRAADKDAKKEAKAKGVVSSTTPTEGTVQEVAPTERSAFNEGVAEVQKNAEEYKKANKINRRSSLSVPKLFEKVSKMMSKAYELVKNEPNQAAVKRAYDAMMSETMTQYDFIVGKGLNVIKHTGTGEPYANSKDMLKDLRENNTLKFLPNEVAFGNEPTSAADNIGLQPSGRKLPDGYELTNSEVFRIVHDYFGHGILGNQFGPIGEENATLQHLDLYSSEAAPAVIFQTRGQNSWVNFSGENTRAAELRKEAKELIKQGKNVEAKKLLAEADKIFKFAEPKIGIFPDIFNFKKYETARRINEQEAVNSRADKGTNDLSRLLGKYSKESRRTRGVNKQNVRGTKRIGGVDVNVINEYTFDDKINNGILSAFKNFKGVQKVYEMTDGKAYREMVIKSLKNNRFASSVTVHTAEEFNKMRMFVTEDGSTGITINEEGFLGGAFSDPSASRPQNLAQLMVLGIKEGATTCEAFDTVLPDYYSQFGFKAVSRTEFNDEYRPMEANGNSVIDWDYETYKAFNNGKPDVVFFIYDGGNRDTIEDRIGLFDTYNNYDKAQTESFDKDGYEHAEEVMKQSAVKRLEFDLGIEEAPKTEVEQEVADLNDMFGEQVGTTTSGTSVADKADMDAMKARTTDEKQLKIIESAEKLSKTLGSVLRNFGIFVHESNESYNAAMASDDVMGVGDTAGNFSYIKNADGTYSGRVDINLSAANERTVAHEVTHGVMLKAFGENPALFKTFRDRMSTILSDSTNKELTDFANQYVDSKTGELKDVAHEEYMTELIAALAEQGGKIPVGTMQKIAVLINKVVSKITNGKFQPFEDIKNTKNLVDFINSVSKSLNKGEVISPSNINKIGLSGVIDTSNAVKSKSSIAMGELKRFPVNENTKLEEDVKLSDFDGKHISLIESDRMTGAHISDTEGNVLYKFYGGVYYPIITGKWWASKEIKKAKEIAEVGNNNRDKDGYIYTAPMVGGADMHMSNVDMLNSTIELMKFDAKNKKSSVTKDDIIKYIKKAFDKKNLADKASILRSVLRKSNNTDTLFDELKYVLLQDGEYIVDRNGKPFLDENKNKISTFAFDERKEIVKGILGDPKVQDNKFPSAGSIIDVAKRFEEPITSKVKRMGDLVTVMRTKGKLEAKVSDVNDEFYHKSYPAEIRAVDENGNPAEIEVFILDGAYSMRDVLPSLKTKKGKEFTWEQYLEYHKEKYNEKQIESWYNRNAKLGAATGKVVSKSQKVKFTDMRGKKVDVELDNIKLKPRDEINLDEENKWNHFNIESDGVTLGYIQVMKKGEDVKIALSSIIDPKLKADSATGKTNFIGKVFELLKEIFVKPFKGDVIIESNKGKGIGSAAYDAMARILKNDYGKKLISDTSRSDNAENLWKSLVKKGKAVVVGDVDSKNRWEHYFEYVVPKEEVTSKSQRTKEDTVNKIVNQARSHGFSEESITKFLTDKGFSDVEIKNALGNAAPTETLSEQKLAGYDAMMTKVDAMVARQKRKNIDEDKMALNVDKLIRDTDAYKNATDAQKKLLELEGRNKVGVRERRAPSIGRILGSIKDFTSLTRNDKLNMIKQIRDLSKDAAKNLAQEIRFIASTGKISPTQASNIVARFGKVNMLSELSVSNFVDYMSKVLNDAQYASKLNEAKGLKGTISQLSRNQEKNANLRELAKEFININPSLVESIDDYNSMANKIKEAIKGSTAVGGKVKFAETVNIEDAVAYTKEAMKNQEEVMHEQKAAEVQNLMGIDSSEFSYDELVDMLKKDKPISKYNESIIKDTVDKMFGTYSAVIKDIIKTGVDPFTGEDVSYTDREKEIITKFMGMDTKEMTTKNSLEAIDAIANFLENKSTAKMDAITSRYIGERNSKIILKKGIMAVPLKKLFSKSLGRVLTEGTTNLSMVFEKMFKGFHRGGEVEKAMGVTTLINKKAFAQSTADGITNDYIKKFYDKSVKPNGEAFNSAENNIERGMAAFMMRTVIGTEKKMAAEFSRRKGLIEQTIDVLSNGNEKEKEKAAIYREVYEKLLKDSETIKDVKDKTDKINLDAVDYWHKQWDSKYDRLSDVATNVYNKVLTKDLNYSPDRYSKMGSYSENVDLANDQSAFINNTNGVLYNKKSGVLEDVTHTASLPKDDFGKVMSFIDLSFDKNNSNSMYDALVDIETAAPIRQVQAFMESKNFEKIIPTAEDAQLLKNRINLYVQNIRKKSPYTNDEYSKAIRRINKIAAVGVGQALGGITQPFKQVIPVAINTVVNGGGISLGAAFDGNFNNWLNKSGYAIANRGIESQAEIQSINKMIEEASKSNVSKAIKIIEEANKKWIDLFLVKPDVLVARASFKTFYEQSLKKQRIDVNGLDYSTHKVNEEAADYAQKMVDRQQNISDHDLGGKLFTSKEPSTQVLMKIFMPFASFRMNQSTRLASDMSVLGHWKISTPEDKMIAARSLAGFAAEMATFKVMSTLVSVLIGNIAASIMGKDENDEEKKKRIDGVMKGQATGAVTDIFSPLPILDKFVQTGVASISDAVQQSLDISEEDRMNIYGTRKEDFVKNFGMYGIAPDRAIQFYELVKLAQTGTYKDDFGKEKQISSDSQDALKKLVGPALLTNIGMAPSELASVIRNAVSMAKKKTSGEKSAEKAQTAAASAARSGRNLLEGYDSRESMRRYNPRLYEQTFGKKSDWYKEHKSEMEQKKKERQAERKAQDIKENYHPNTKTKTEYSNY